MGTQRLPIDTGDDNPPMFLFEEQYSMTLTKIISGGQTGVDQAALRAARDLGITTSGTAPLGWITEDGPAPWLADFGLIEADWLGYLYLSNRKTPSFRAGI